jgi:deoxyadenosine/deoxycytidine kinase
MIISLDGNIGAGKTTLLQAIQIAMPDVEVVLEPVDIWTSLVDADGKSLLALFYEDQRRWAYTFQTCALMTRMRALREAKGKVVITERSVLTDRFVFAKMLRDSCAMTDVEWTLYCRLWDQFAAELPVSAVIYLTTGVGTSAERIVKRGRVGETMSLDYLATLDAAHQQWIEGAEVPVLRLSTEPDTDPHANLCRIREFIDSLQT